MRPVDRYEAFLLDLDGVLYRGEQPVAGAGQAVEGLREAGRTVVFLTNNSARTPNQVAEKLRDMGVEASPGDVVTSAQATAGVVARMAREDSRAATAYVIGERGVREALTEAGIEVLDGEPPGAGFVVVGWDRGVDYDRLRTATVLVRSGARLVATNADASYPAPDGQEWPGAGALLAAVETASSARATVVGKPHRPLFDAAVERAGTDRALVVGDRLETDILGALHAGLDSALVLSGAAAAEDLLDQDGLPLMVLDDVGGLLEERPDARVRRAQDEDAPGIRALLRAASLDPNAVEDSFSRTVVASDGGVLAAAAAPVRGQDAYLHSVAVAEEARGSRLGTLVTATALRGAAAEGARLAYLLTETAEGFFGRLGFQRIGRGELPGWIVGLATGCSESAVALRRRLRGPIQ
jgi:HAD superfamily hydrolase (TIGR01457 family)